MSIQSGADRQRFSKLRQTLVQFAGEIRPLVRSMISDKPVVRGSVYELKRKCGKPGCKCAKGELHPSMVLSDQQFRRARARLGEIHKKMLSIIDEMEAMRTEPMVPEKPGGGGKQQEEA